MAKKGIVQNVVNKSEKIVGSVVSGVGKFVGNVVPKSIKRAIRGGGCTKYGGRKTRKSRKSRKSRKN
jgi:hypothetical protein